jgi:hypothetical protein
MAEENVGEHQSQVNVLVLGSAPHTRLVTAYTWDNCPEDLNVADYDVVILNLVPFRDDQSVRDAHPLMLIPWSAFARLVLNDRSEVVVIGMPILETAQRVYRFTDWLPSVPECVLDCGRTIREVNPEYAYYFDHVKSWCFHTTPRLSAKHPPETYIQSTHLRGNNLRAHMSGIAFTQSGGYVGFELRFDTLDQTVHIASGAKVIWLPPPTEISDYEAVNLILRERYDLGPEQAPPDWVEPYKLPEQLPIENKMAQLREKIQHLEVELRESQQQLSEVERFKRLLYEQGEDGLEPVVRDVFGVLGAQVSEPQQSGHEDGRLIAPAGQNGMLEIKGLTKSLRLRNVRELQQWVSDAIAEEGWEGKGLLVANTYCGDPIGKRGEPFPPNCVGAAERFGQCLMTTTQLFRALCSHQCGELDVDAFWNILFDTNGVCPLPDLEPLAEKTQETEEANT